MEISIPSTKIAAEVSSHELSIAKIVFNYSIFDKTTNIKKAIKISIGIIGSFLTLFLILFLILNISFVQTFIVQKLTKKISQTLGAEVSLKRINIQLPDIIEIDKLLVKDQQQDTLFYFNTLEVSLLGSFYSKNLITIGGIDAKGIRFKLYSIDSTGKTNMSFLLANETQSDIDTPTNTPTIKLRNIELKGLNFSYFNKFDNKAIDSTFINFSDINVFSFNLSAEDFTIDGGALKADLRNISFKEKSGFILTKMSGSFKLDSTIIELKELDLITKNSHLKDYFAMKVQSWDDYSDFFHKVIFELHNESAYLDLNDLSYFQVPLNILKKPLSLNGKINGPLASLETKILEISIGNSKIYSKVKLEGIPKISECRLNATIKNSYVSISDFYNLSNLFTDTLLNNNILLNAEYNGSFSNFLIKADALVFDSKVQLDGLIDIESTFKYDVNIKIDSLKPNIILQNAQMVDFITTKGKIKGSGLSFEAINSNAILAINALRINNYTYKNINVIGTLEQKLFNGEITIRDPNLELDFNGFIDFNNTLPRYKFKAYIGNAQLKTLHLNNNATNFSTYIDIDLRANSIDNVLGRFSANYTTLSFENQSINIDRLNLIADSNNNQKSIILQSDLADIQIIGKYQLLELWPSLTQLFNTYMENVVLFDSVHYVHQDFSFYALIKDFTIVSKLFSPDLKVKNGTIVSGALNNDKNILNIRVSCPNISYKTYALSNIIMDIENSDKAIYANIYTSGLFNNDSLILKEITIANILQENKVFQNIKLGNTSGTNFADLYANIIVQNKDSIFYNILPSEININNIKWNIPKQFNIKYLENKFIVSDFNLQNGTQFIKARGVLSDQEKDMLYVEISDINLNLASQILKNFDQKIEGVVNGKASFKSVLGSPLFAGDLSIKNLSYNETFIGEYVNFYSGWNPNQNEITFNGTILSNSLKTIKAIGKINLTQTPQIEATLTLNQSELELLSPFVDGILSSISGLVSAELSLRGNLKKPTIEGNINLNNAKTRIDFLNVDVQSSGNIKIKNSTVQLERLEILDEIGNKGYASGSIDLNDISAPLFNINLITNNFKALNTPASKTALYYGQAFASGTFRFRGKLDDMYIGINASTDPGTRFYIPLSNTSSYQEQNFITFKTRGEKKKESNNTNNYKGIILDFELSVDEDAEVQMVFDEKVGDVIKGSGNGNLKLEINTLGDFLMYGGLSITRGEYLFTLQNIINKRLKVESGSSLRWNGNPYEASVDIKANYITTASILPLYQAADYQGALSKTDSTKRIPVSCAISMKNNLFNPDISFGLDFPRNPEVNNQLSGYLLNKDNVSTQAISILATGNFSKGISGNGSSLGFEVITNQISNVLSSLYKGLDFNLNSLNNAGGSYSFKRFEITGNFYSYSNNTNNNVDNTRNSSFGGDILAEYKISPNGNFRAKIFNKLQTNDFVSGVSNNQNIQGIGLLYNTEFDNLKDLKDKLFKSKQTTPKDSL